MDRERLYLFDTTLRDGAQTNGVDFTLNDKLAIARMLDDLGIDYVEGGYPGANLTDTQLFAEERGLRATFTAFGMTRRPGRSPSNDPGLAALLDAKADAICFVAKSWDYHVRVALETTPEENLASIRDSVRAPRAQGREGLLRCEHFFDGYKGEFVERFEIGVSDAQLEMLAHASHTLDEMLNRAPNRHAPYVGESAFATKAGIHASAIMKDPATYEHVPPERVGNRRRLLVSDQAGRSNVLAELARIGLMVDKDDPRIGRLLDVVKEREALGYSYEAADASFELLARRVFG